jgi:hypothetical protein
MFNTDTIFPEYFQFTVDWIHCCKSHRYQGCLFIWKGHCSHSYWVSLSVSAPYAPFVPVWDSQSETSTLGHTITVLAQTTVLEQTPAQPGWRSRDGLICPFRLDQRGETTTPSTVKGGTASDPRGPSLAALAFCMEQVLGCWVEGSSGVRLSRALRSLQGHWTWGSGLQKGKKELQSWRHE